MGADDVSNVVGIRERQLQDLAEMFLALQEKARKVVFWRIISGLLLATAFCGVYIAWNLQRLQKEMEYIQSYQRIADEAKVAIQKTDNPEKLAYWHMRISYVQAMQSRMEDACRTYEIAKKIDPLRTAECMDTTELGVIQYKRRHYAEAKNLFEEIISAEPRLLRPYSTYAWLLATSSVEEMRSGKRAVAVAEKGLAVANDVEKRSALEVMAAACAENGDFDKAIDCQKKAMTARSLLDAESEKIRQEQMAYDLLLYEAKIPLRRWLKSQF